MDIAPEIVSLAWKKKLTVSDALDGGKWMRGIQHMSTEEQVGQFVRLWEMIQNVQLSDQEDTISWELTSSGKYTAKSAYDAQFFGRIPQPHLEKVWKIKAEGKVKFYIWFLLQNRNWTSDRLEKRGWTDISVCRLCEQEQETALHILLGCSYAKECWFGAKDLNQRVADIALKSNSIMTWWCKLNEGVLPKELRQTEVTLAVYMVWHLWNDRNHRVFEDKRALPQVIVQMVKDDSGHLDEAFRE